MRRRLVLAIAAVAAIAVVLLAVPLALVLGRSYRDEELLRLQRDTIAATRGIDLGATPSDEVELPPTGDALAVYRKDGTLAAGRGPARAPALVRTALRTGRAATATGSGMLDVTVPLLDRERVAGAVLAARSDASARERTDDAWLVVSLVAIGIILAAILAAVILGRRLALPLERLATAARRLGEGDFSARAPRARIAEIDAVGGAFDRTAERLDELVQRERSFSADASHQLRTPLAALRLELEAMELRESGHRELPASLAQVDRLQSTIDTLLNVARDRSRATSTIELDPLLDDLENHWRGAFADHGRPLRVAGARSGVVHATPGIVREVLDVVLANALTHGRGQVTINARAADGWAFLDVTDEGPGFDDPDGAFDRRPTSAGHGIGLALARSLAHADGGRLTITRAGQRPRVTLALRSAVGHPAA
jgi:signal transduction histidine kinase